MVKKKKTQKKRQTTKPTSKPAVAPTPAQRTAMARRDPVRIYVHEMMGEIEKALPAHITKEQSSIDRWARILETEFRLTPKLLNCTPMSLKSGILEAAQLGLEIASALGHCYLIPYKNSKTGYVEANFQIGYQGFVELAYRSGHVRKVEGDVVYECEWKGTAGYFDYEYGTNEYLRHKPDVLVPIAKRGPMVAAYCKIELAGGAQKFKVMPWDEIMKVKAMSKTAHLPDSPWNKWPDQQAIKTVWRREQKLVPKLAEDANYARAVQIDNADYDLSRPVPPPPAGGPVIDVPAEQPTGGGVQQTEEVFTPPEETAPPAKAPRPKGRPPAAAPPPKEAPAEEEHTPTAEEEEAMEERARADEATATAKAEQQRKEGLFEE